MDVEVAGVGHQEIDDRVPAGIIEECHSGGLRGDSVVEDPVARGVDSRGQATGAVGGGEGDVLKGVDEGLDDLVLEACLPDTQGVVERVATRAEGEDQGHSRREVGVILGSSRGQEDGY